MVDLASIACPAVDTVNTMPHVTRLMELVLGVRLDITDRCVTRRAVNVLRKQIVCHTLENAHTDVNLVSTGRSVTMVNITNNKHFNMHSFTLIKTPESCTIRIIYILGNLR